MRTNNFFQDVDLQEVDEQQPSINPLSIRIEDKELTEEQLRRKYPFSYGQVSAKGTGIEGAKEGLTQAVDLATDVAPFIGTAKAATELPEDARFAKQLIEEGYDEGDIKKMGLGAGFGTLTALGFLPGAKIATDLGKRAVKEGVAETASDVAAQTRAAFKADPSSMDSARKKRLIEESKKLPPDMRRKFIKEGMRPTPKLFHGAKGIGDFEVDDTQLLADIEEAQRSGVTMPMKEIYKMNNGSTIDADEFFMQAAAKGINIPHVQGVDGGNKYLDFRRIEDGGETENGLRVIKLVSDDTDLIRRVVVPQKDGKIELFAVQEKIKEHMQMNQDATETFKRSPESLVPRGQRLSNEGFEPYTSFKGERGLTGDSSGRHAELKEKALSMSRDPLVSMKPGFGARRLDNIVYSDLPMSLQRNIKPSDYDDISNRRVFLGDIISRMTDEEIDKVFNNAPEFYEAMKKGKVNLHARIVPSEAAAKRNIGLSLPKSDHLEAETAILEPQELGVSRLSKDSDEVREIYPIRFGIKTKRKRKKDLGKLPLEERVKEGQKLANTVLDRLQIIEESGDTMSLPVSSKVSGRRNISRDYNYQAIKEMFTDLQSLGQFTEQYGARGTYDSLLETVARSRQFRKGLQRTADAFKDASPEKYKHLKMIEVLVNHPSTRRLYTDAERMARTQQRTVKDKTLLDFIESDVGVPLELSSTVQELAYNDVKRAMFLLTQKLNRGGLMAKR